MKNKKLEIIDEIIIILTNKIKKIQIGQLIHVEEINQFFYENGNLKELTRDEKMNQIRVMLNILGSDMKEILVEMNLRTYSFIFYYKNTKYNNIYYRFLIQVFLIKRDYESLSKLQMHELKIYKKARLQILKWKLKKKMKGSYK